MRSIPERDWKVFAKLHGALIERLYERFLNDATRAATDSRHEPSERFAQVARLMREGQKDLSDLADHRRSTAFLVIARLYHREKVFLPGEFEQFSEETRNHVIACGSLWEDE